LFGKKSFPKIILNYREKNFVLHTQIHMTSAEYVKLFKQVTYIEDGKNMILFHEEFVPTVCTGTANARIL